MKKSSLRDLIRETIKEVSDFDRKFYSRTKDDKEGSFDSRFKKAMGGAGFSDEEQDDIISKDTPSTKGISGYQKARDLITNLRSDYRSMSDSEMEEFSKEMINHFKNTL